MQSLPKHPELFGDPKKISYRGKVFTDMDEVPKEVMTEIQNARNIANALSKSLKPFETCTCINAMLNLVCSMGHAIGMPEGTLTDAIKNYYAHYEEERKLHAVKCNNCQEKTNDTE